MQSQNKHIQTLLEERPIDGVDYADGIRRFGDQATVYLRIIKSFIKNTPVLLEELGTARPESLDEYAVRVHGLKGSCYGISAMKLGDEAKTLELASKAADWMTVERGNPELIEHVRLLIGQLKELVHGIEQAEGGAGDKRPLVDTPDRNTLHLLLGAVRSLDVELLERTLADMDRVRYSTDAKLVERLKEYLMNFRYDLIEETVRELLG